MKELFQKIRSLSGKNYGTYRQFLGKTFLFGDFTLEFLHIQGDPYAPPSRILCRATLSSLGWKPKYYNTALRQKVFSDFLHRILAERLTEQFPEKNEGIHCSSPGQEILIRNTVFADNGNLLVSLLVHLPGEKRVIHGEQLQETLTLLLPDILLSLYFSEASGEKLLRAIFVQEVREALLSKLAENNWVAFIPDGAVLPREDGLSEKPLPGALPFYAPEEWAKEVEVCGIKIRGLSIPKGLTVITGGAFHGKSTLLSALSSAGVPHIEGDGREWIVVEPLALPVRSEEGRSVRHADISSLIRYLPGKKSPTDFTTAKASGSTSEAANFLEMLEIGARTFFIDEDASAVNFLMRDSRIRALIGDDSEPLIPLIDKIGNLTAAGCNFILVAGACGDYLEMAERIILMENYAVKAIPEFQTQNISKSPEKFPQKRFFDEYAKELFPSVKPLSAVERHVKVRFQGSLLRIGFLLADLSRVRGLSSPELALGAGTILLNLLQNPRHESIGEVIDEWVSKIERIGFRNLPQGMSKDLSLPSREAIACALFRLRDYGR